MMFAAGFYFIKRCGILGVKSLNSQRMDDETKKEEKFTTVETEQKLGVGVKVLLTVILLGAVAAGIYAAIALSR